MNTSVDLILLHLKQAADVLALEATMQRRAGKVRDRPRVDIERMFGRLKDDRAGGLPPAATIPGAAKANGLL